MTESGFRNLSIGVGTVIMIIFAFESFVEEFVNVKFFAL